MSSLERTRRIDAEFYQSSFTKSAQAVEALPSAPINALARISDGNHFTISDAYTDEGVPYFRGQDISGAFFADPHRAAAITQEAFDRRYMRRSHLQIGDVLLSIVGTIGATALIKFEKPATCSCKLAILRPAEVNGEYLAAYLSGTFGQTRIKQLTRGAVQGGLLLEDMDQIAVPRFDGLEPHVVELARAAYEADQRAALIIAQAEADLLDTLGLGDWSPPEPLTYTRSASAVAYAGRLDAEFAAPRIQALLDKLGRDGVTLGDVTRVRRDRFCARRAGQFRYTEIGDLDGFGRSTSTELEMIDAPSRATWLVHTGDVITSTVRPIRRLSAIITPDENGTVCSSGFVVLEPLRVSSELLLTYLRLPLIAELLHLFATASMYPALAEADLLNLPMPLFDEDTDSSIQRDVQEAHALLAQSEALLSAAKRAVEIAIEDGEEAALAHIAEQEAALAGA